MVSEVKKTIDRKTLETHKSTPGTAQLPQWGNIAAVSSSSPELYVLEVFPLRACFDSDGYFKDTDELYKSEKFVVQQLSNGEQVLKHYLPGNAPYVIGNKESGSDSFQVKNNAKGKEITESLVNDAIAEISDSDDDYIYLLVD